MDKAKQVATAAKSEAHLNEGGMIYVLPEGRLNREDSTKLQPYRKGSFATMAQRRCAVFALVTAGCEDVWPINEAFGGKPATIHAALVRISSGEEELSGDAEKLSCHAHERMQVTLDHLTILRKAELEEESIKTAKHNSFGSKDGKVAKVA